MPRLLREAVEEALSAEPDMVVAGELDTSDCPDFVVIGGESGDCAETYRHLLSQCPRMRVIAVSGHGERSFLHDLRPHVTQLGELTPAGIVETIKAYSLEG